MVERRYMLDTNILSSLIKWPSSPMANKIMALDSGKRQSDLIYR
jgi:predicted nucleic acid-binding protein